MNELTDPSDFDDSTLANAFRRLVAQCLRETPADSEQAYEIRGMLAIAGGASDAVLAGAARTLLENGSEETVMDLEDAAEAEFATESKDQRTLNLQSGGVAAPALAWAAGAAILATMAMKTDPVTATLAAVAVCSIGAAIAAASVADLSSKGKRMASRSKTRSGELERVNQEAARNHTRLWDYEQRLRRML